MTNFETVASLAVGPSARLADCTLTAPWAVKKTNQKAMTGRIPSWKVPQVRAHCDMTSGGR